MLFVQCYLCTNSWCIYFNLFTENVYSEEDSPEKPEASRRRRRTKGQQSVHCKGGLEHCFICFTSILLCAYCYLCIVNCAHYFLDGGKDEGDPEDSDEDDESEEEGGKKKGKGKKRKGKGKGKFSLFVPIF